jgi:hypothetical protein
MLLNFEPKYLPSLISAVRFFGEREDAENHNHGLCFFLQSIEVLCCNGSTSRQRAAESKPYVLNGDNYSLQQQVHRQGCREFKTRRGERDARYSKRQQPGGGDGRTVRHIAAASGRPSISHHSPTSFIHTDTLSQTRTRTCTPPNRATHAAARNPTNFVRT